MTDHDDTQLDAALEALARPEPPSDHVARVLARTGPDGMARAGRGASPRRPDDALLWLQPAAYLRPRWILPVAATVLVALGATWQMNRQMEAWLAAEMARSESGPYQPREPYQLHVPYVWGAPGEIDRPVLPPQAYWGMDAFDEFEKLRPGGRNASPRRPSARARVTSPDDEWIGTSDIAETARSESGPYQQMLPAIELEPIEPAPLIVAPVAPLDVIALAEIPLAPIVIGPLSEEERP